jgi:hypothetical protein
MAWAEGSPPTPPAAGGLVQVLQAEAAADDFFLDLGEGVDLQKVRQRAGHGSLEVTSRYAAILDERDTSLADALEEIFDGSHAAAGSHENTTGADDAAQLLSISTE